MSGRNVASALFTLAGVAALAAVVAYWGWRWLAPAPPTAPVASVDDFATVLAASPPFGASAPGAALPVVAAPGPATGEPRLLGVLAEHDGQGRALLRLPDGSPRLAAVGESLGALGTLTAVHPDGVTLRDGRGERRIDLRAQPALGAAHVAPVRGAACVPAGYRGPVIRLNAELVAGLIAQPESLTAVAEARDGALVVREESGFAAMLGLKKGDRIVQANGIALRAPEDVVIALLRPLQANQPVRVSGLRGSAPQELLIVNAGACT